MIQVSCVACGQAAADDADVANHRCLSCGSVLEATRAVTGEPPDPDPRYQHSLWRYRERLPVDLEAEPVTLGEGMTPLRRCPQLDDLVGSRVRVWVKDETANPTGSFKDRLVSVAITRARHRGATVVTCASSGNAAASTAAYAAAAEMRSVVFVPAGTPLAKVNQARAHGAFVVAVPGDYSNSYLVCDAVATQLGWPNLTTTYLNPYGTAGLATVGYELVEEFTEAGEPVDLVSIPLGSGPLLYGIDRGWREASPAAGGAGEVALLGVQANGCAPIVAAFEAGRDEVTPWGVPTTFASGISDPLRGYPEDGTCTLSIIRRAGGSAVAVTDASIRWAADQLARKAGILAEPTGAASLAGVAAHLKATPIRDGANVVVCVTGHGFKDPDRMPAPAHDTVVLSEKDATALMTDDARPHHGERPPLRRLHDQLARAEGQT